MSLRQTRTTACREGHAASGTRITSFNSQPFAAEALAVAASTSLARGAQRSLVRTAANLYGAAAIPGELAFETRTCFGDDPQGVHDADLLAAVTGLRWISGAGSAAWAPADATSSAVKSMCDRSIERLRQDLIVGQART